MVPAPLLDPQPVSYTHLDVYKRQGRARIYGRMGAMLEVGTGFHPEQTGRENVYLYGTILGMTRSEINNKFDEILDFSGTGNLIDTPVKRYSCLLYTSRCV